MGKDIEKISLNLIETHKMWYDKFLPDLLVDLTDFPYAVIKGDVLSKLAYGDVGYRDCHDIDFLVPKRLRGDFQKILFSNGFVEDIRDNNGAFRKLTRMEKIIMLNSHQDIDYIKYLGNEFVNLDVNYDLFWGEYTGKRIDILNDFLDDTHVEKVFNQNVKVLSNIKNFIQLCLHHYREMNAIYLFKLDNPFNFSMFRDVFYLYKMLSLEEIKDLCELIDKFCIKEYVFYVTYHASMIYKDDKWFYLLNHCDTKEGRYLLECYGLTDLERKKWHISLEKRMNCVDLYSEVEPYLTQKDKKKVDMTIGFISSI